jgi:hypothetical protein
MAVFPFWRKQALGSPRNTTLQKLTQRDNSITSTGVGALAETMDGTTTSRTLSSWRIGKEGANLPAVSL